MLLRRVSKHVKEENWFAIGLDFLIVVVGVFIGLQAANWNDARNDLQSRGYHLDRLKVDLRDTIEGLEAQEAFSVQKLEIIDDFAEALGSADVEAEDLLAKTTLYFTQGTALSDFKVTRVTFDDLSATGGLENLGNSDLTAALIKLHTNYALQNEDLLLNADWIMPIDSQLVSEFDWMRYDPMTAHLFPPKAPEKMVSEILASQDKILHHAAIHYWFSATARRDYRDTIEQAQTVLDMLEAETGAR